MLFDMIEKNEEIRTYIESADEYLKKIGFTEHSFAHVKRCVVVAEYILSELGYDEHTIDLTKIACFMHDIGNVINRADHAQSGAVMAFRILDKLGIKTNDIALIISAIGNHDEKTSTPFNAISSALVLADKTDVRRSRVRAHTTDFDIHDRVNYAVEKSEVIVDKENKNITLKLIIDTNICAIIDYFEIFLDRMLLCKKAANYLGLTFKLCINDQILL